MLQLPEVFVSTRETSRRVGQMVREGSARKLGPTLYTSNMHDAPEAIVSRNAWAVADLLVPGTVVSHRTAFEGRPGDDGSLFVTGGYPRRIDLPGLTIRQLAGPGPTDSDGRYMGSLYLSSEARTLLENLEPSRKSDRAPKTVGRDAVEQRLAQIVQNRGEEGLNRLRDRARAIAPDLGLGEEYETLAGLVGTLLGSRAVRLRSDVGRARAQGEPYDVERMPAFDALFSKLHSGEWPSRPDPNPSADAFRNVAFFDAYFSNYIEGTDFVVDEAIEIVFEQKIPAGRPEDAHDILGTYRLVSSQEQMHRVPRDFDEFVDLLKSRHTTILEARPDKLPGEFKSVNNQAGSTLFVPPGLVLGTLRQGFMRYSALNHPFARALFMMFVVAEVHPFVDGNGRLARIMMNAELVAGRQERVIIPSVFRNEYVGSLKRLTNHRNAEAFVRVMDQAQILVATIDFGELGPARLALDRANAFRDPADDLKLILPT